MKGNDEQQTQLFSYLPIDQRIPEDHPLREIRDMTNFIIQRMSRKLYALYSYTGRPSIPPEQLLRALILQILYSIRSERMLMEQMNYNLLFRWFVGLNPDDPVWNHAVFSKNRDRFLNGGLSKRFFREVVALARNYNMLSEEHFTIDGTLIESLASLKSFQPKRGKKNKKDNDPGNPTIDFRGEKRSNATHESTTDPDALLYRKGMNREAKLYFSASVLMDNRHGLITDCEVSSAKGRAEREDALTMLKRLRKRIPKGRITVGMDKGYDVSQFVEDIRKINITGHIAMKKYTALDMRTARHDSYRISQKKRKLVEEIFGWQKTFGLQKKSRFVGHEKISWFYTMSACVYNLMRIRNIAGVSYV